MLAKTKGYPRAISIAFEMTTLLFASLVIATLSQIEIKLWFTPVPITMGTIAPILTGATLGPRRGALAVLLYLAEGAIGIPVFSGGAAGLGVLAGPTGGYLIGYIFAAATSGFVVQRGFCETFGSAFVSFLATSCCFFVFGLPWLSFYVGTDSALLMGLYPFVLGDFIKSLLCASYVVGRRRFG